MKKIYKFIIILSFFFFMSSCNLDLSGKKALSTPKVNVSANGVATWTIVDEAINYAYRINESEELYTTSNEVQLNEGDTIQVKAIGDTNVYYDSAWSQLVTYIPEKVFYTVKFFDIDNNLLEELKVLKGENAIFTKKIPEINDPNYQYYFKGWDKDLSSVNDNLDVYPLYDKVLIDIVNRIKFPEIVESINGYIFWPSVDNALKYAYQINNQEIMYTDNLFLELNDGDEVKIKAVAKENYIDSIWSDTFIISIKTNKQYLDYDAKDIADYNIYEIDAMPSIGIQNTIVIPVWFNDSSKYIKISEKEDVRRDIELAFFGTSEETGWNSVQSYFYQDSYGKLTINGFVTDWYSCNQNANNITETGVENIVKDSFNWFKNTYNEDLTKYDSDQNGLIDSLCLIYGYPNCDSIGSSNDNLWAYVYWLQDETQKDFENPGINTYLFASYDYMYSDAGNNANCVVDAHTYIHEMGHVLGLEDYYDYSGYTNPAGGFSMQDCNVGGHDPYTKLQLNWVDPYVVNDSCTITIKPFESTGDLILLAPSGYNNSVYDEYFLIELYTPMGLNEFDTKYEYMSDWPKGPNAYGIRIWHVDARLLYLTNINQTFTANQITNTINSNYYYYQAMSNTYPIYGYDSYAGEIEQFRYFNLLYLVRNNTSLNYKTLNNLDENTFFKTGDMFSMSKYSKQFYNKELLNNKKSLGYTIEFLYVSEELATIKFNKIS